LLHCLIWPIKKRLRKRKRH
ncbi:hypothetical protein D049_2503B, partial [Vibrio parahaemolyticus VPTS-2010]